MAGWVAVGPAQSAAQGLDAHHGAVLVRVGLATDLDAFSLPCCQPVSLRAGDERRLVRAPVRVLPAGKARPGWFALQLAAVKDEDQANGLARRLEALVEAEMRVVFDVSSSLYRVRAGRFESSQEAERLLARLADHGFEEGWVTREGGGLERSRLQVAVGDEVREAAGRWVVVDPGGQETQALRLERGRLRGRLLLYLNDRGLLNLINELPLEEYLRGVVPLEMGPEQYDSVEALKAQAVAARTFTLRSLGGFLKEGFDICASPRCQVYGGRDAEHPLSDRAVAATTGEVVLHGGELAEALYSSSCGGFTENVETVFPRKRAAYLRGTPCPEGAPRLLEGSVPAGTSFAAAVMRLLLPARDDPSPLSYQRRLETLARLAGLPRPDDALASLRRQEVRRFLASLFDLGVDVRVFRNGPVAARASWSAAEKRLHRRLVGEEALPDSLVTAREMEEVLLDLALAVGILSQERAYFLDLVGDQLRVRAGGRAKTVRLPSRVAVLQGRGGDAVAASLRSLPGDRLRLVWNAVQDRLLAVVGEHEAARGPSPRRRPWRLFREERELRRSVRGLYPGFELESMEVVSRGVSGRIGALRLRDRLGETILLRGLAVRWTLGTPDTWFSILRMDGESKPGWLLEGRGHGHGVGMCQLGAVLMARRGHNYREILAHYYAGAKLGRLRSPRS